MTLRRLLLGAALAGSTTIVPAVVSASSHREAPFISRNPKVDGTDYYAFSSYETGRTCLDNGSANTTNGPCGYVTLIANYQPLEDAAGGPNFFTMDPNAVYEIHIDNDGDGAEDLTFQFQFQDALAGGTGAALPIGYGSDGSTDKKMVAIPFAYAGGTNGGGHGFGAINHAGTSGLVNVTETYTMNVISGPRRTGTVTSIKDLGNNPTFGKPVDNVGPNTVGEGSGNVYENYAKQFIVNFDSTQIPGCNPTHVVAGTHSRIFVGQRQEGFAVNLGQVFDTVHFTAGPGGAGLADVIGDQDQGLNDVGGKNVTAIAIEVPAECLVKSGNTTNTFGSWTTASVRQARVLNPTPTFGTPDREGGPLVQVSRLGLPLINEVIIGLPDKDNWNSSEPKDDAQWETYTTNPTLPTVVAVLFGGAGVVAPDFDNRPDLDAAFNTGALLNSVNVNQIIPNPTNKAEMLRLNTNIGGANGLGQTSATPRAGQNSQLGALGCFDNPDNTPGTLAALNPVNHLGQDCDPYGFPNGRRPGDDVTDIELRVAMGAIVNRADAPTGGCLHVFGALDNQGSAVGPSGPDTFGPDGCVPYVDGAANNAPAMQAVFPYLNSPLGAK